MANAPTLEVVKNFSECDRMLEEILRVVPYCPEHHNVWSQRLVTVLLESCTQLARDPFGEWTCDLHCYSPRA